MRKILAIDGGGIKGVFPAAFLAAIEESLGESVASYFDLIVGTSTGGIIAIGLGLGLPAADILRLYEDMGPRVFAQPGPFMRRLRSAQFNQQPLREALHERLGDRVLGESQNRLVIPSFNAERGVVHLYKTAHHPRFELDYKKKAVEVALATAAAPTYFPIHVSSDGIPLVDGGVFANNPVGLAVVEAIGVLEWPKDDVVALSLGCTTPPFDPRARIRGLKVKGDGFVYWGAKGLDVFMAAQSSASIGTAQVLIGHDRVFRISPPVPSGRFSLASTKDTPALKGLGNAFARERLPKLRERFFNEKSDPFHPCRSMTNERIHV